jgi:hypothetical protein
VAGHPHEQTSNAAPYALLDTTVQLDRRKYPSRKDKLENMLADYQLKFATSLSLVEFKATIIQECITIHNQLRSKGARFTRARDILLEKKHRQVSLRVHIFNNILNVFGRSSFEMTQKEDEVLAERARLQLENIIPELFRWFSSEESVDAILKDKLQCDRAREAPVKKSAAFSTNLPACRRGQNKTCRVEDLIRTEAPALIAKLTPSLDESEPNSQLRRPSEVFESVISNPNKELSVDDCRRAGDCLIALEAIGSATHVLSSNASEWKPISQALDFKFIHITYPEEKTRS